MDKVAWHSIEMKATFTVGIPHLYGGNTVVFAEDFTEQGKRVEKVRRENQIFFDHDDRILKAIESRYEELAKRRTFVGKSSQILAKDFS